VDVLADTAHAAPREVAPPSRASVWLERVGPVAPAALDLPPPDAPPDSTIPDAPSALAVEAGLLPPLLLGPAPLVVPPGGQGRGRESVELDVCVSESGAVTEARWAGGSADTALVAAATDCARRMRFLPARRGDQPVVVWCRQRFDFRRGRNAGAGGRP
jgi:protein TonB